MTAKLFGMPGSLYTARARSYLLKQHYDFEETIPADPAWPSVTQAVGRWIIPVLQLSDGTLVQDGVAIIDHVEASGAARRSAYPETPVHRAIAHVFELFGGEGLLRPAMHYRWDYDAENLAFLRADFLGGLFPGAPAEAGDAVFANASGRMRKARDGFGVSAETAPAIQASYHDFLARLDAHLAHYPYLLGGRPTLGDYALIGPLYPHLGRDPYPAAEMKRRAFHVWRWVERMQSPQAQLGGYPDETLIAGDAVPDTLAALLAFVAEDFLPELAAHVDFAARWLAEHPGLEPGTNGLPNPGARAIGKAAFAWRGHQIETLVMPYRFWLLQRLQAALTPAAQAVLDQAGLGALATLTLPRRVERVNNLEVWGPAS
ncbi:glutathione S-transferase N-terminal domain-containing protein [Sphingomonas sp.]|uniref:glutathione S-transferase N-terminal domain-containing protein n=1 Tax=Sphingomonas sp. TaxID=28214 RepID=UPI001D50BD23|nr:glutathione S-transferase N-terminal domain-containing protein [Sphingomonas sp.]MBX9795610.1 glutathione S-transferase C-terminal domain-containing protein [Sphingomonas sp.]